MDFSEHNTYKWTVENLYACLIKISRLAKKKATENKLMLTFIVVPKVTTIFAK